MKYDFIEIGTSDFDTLLQTTENQIGLSIEPLKIYLNRLPNNSHVIKVNCAISDKNGTTNVFWVKPEDIDEYELSGYLKGCNSIIRPHITTERELKEKQLEFLLNQTECEMITWDRLVERYDIENVDLLKIDTEGHDCIIVNSILDSKCKVLPKKLWFEANELTNPKFIEKTVKRLESFGYTIIDNNGWDVIVEKL
jgi:FkbM family methyltransferase